jgi:hypothetical protein
MSAQILALFPWAVPVGHVHIVNLTPHACTLAPWGGSDPTAPPPDDIIIPAPPKGRDARSDDDAPRLDTERTEAFGFPVAFPHEPGPLVGLPAPVDGVVFLVSLVVRRHPSAVGRRDLVSPGTGPKDGARREPATLPDGSKNPRGGQILACSIFIGA